MNYDTDKLYYIYGIALATIIVRAAYTVVCTVFVVYQCTQHTNMAPCMSQLTQYLTLVFQYVVSFRMLLVTYEYFKLLLLTMGGTGVK